MYKDIVDPWNQKRDENTDIAVFIALQLLHFITNSKRLLIKSIMDIGCADGYHARKLQDVFTENEKHEYFGTDISSTVISRALSLPNDYQFDCNFVVDDIVKFNDTFTNRFDIVFSSRTLYYVAPEIDAVLDNISNYLSSSGIFCFIYNQSKDAYTSQWLTYELLREKLIDLNFIEHSFIEIDRYSDEVTAIGVFQKNSERIKEIIV
jgi:predicted TPR repeat methyltransferase